MTLPAKGRKAGDPLASLRRMVRGANEEMSYAVALHEAWKPAAHDKNVFGQMGRSLATNTFYIVRAALRRDLILTLSRLWGDLEDEIGMKKVARRLQDRRVSAIIRKVVEQRRSMVVDDGRERDPALMRVLETLEASDRKTEANDIDLKLDQALQIIASYSEGGDKAEILRHLKHFRNKRLVHRDLRPRQGDNERLRALDDGLEAIYEDMMILVSLLLMVVDSHGHDFGDTAKQHRRHAQLFWTGVRGEQTEGHPEFKAKD